MIRALAEAASTKYELEDLVNVAIERWYVSSSSCPR